jgi:undecaprenyl-diphosphatase
VASSNDRSTLWLLLVALACGTAFLALALVMDSAHVVRLDTSIIAFAQGLPMAAAAWEAVTDLGGGLLLVVVDVGIVLFLVSRRELGLALLVAVTLIVVAVGVDQAKELTARPRREDALVFTTGDSFPSGHAFYGTVTYGLLALVAWRSDLASSVRLGFAVAMITVIVLIGWSRVALGAHYPTDVAAGWAGGLAVLAIVAAVARASSRSAAGRPGR